jgi:hypothetical protein
MPVSTGYRKLPVEYLNQFNENVQSAADSTGCYYADLYSHFRGHGAECGSSEDFWYFAANPLELNHRGANEIRRVWLRSLENTPIFV